MDRKSFVRTQSRSRESSIAAGTVVHRGTSFADTAVVHNTSKGPSAWGRPTPLDTVRFNALQRASCRVATDTLKGCIEVTGERALFLTMNNASWVCAATCIASIVAELATPTSTSMG